MKDIKAFK